jgi:FSR family fosmidomycin resistance protein-like MFS transporter
VSVRLLAAALAVEFVDELVDGTKGASLPLIRHDLSLSYAQVGLLLSLPILIGSVIELPLGIAAGEGARRHRAITAGGVVFAVSLLAVASARSFPLLLGAFIAFFPASGAFVGLAQADLMDADPARRPRNMAAWTATGSVGALAGPALIIIGVPWRVAFFVSAAAAVVALLGRQRAATNRGHVESRASIHQVFGALRRGDVLRWLTLLQLSDLLLDVLTGFIALYLVDVDHRSAAWAAGAVAIRIGSGLVGEVALVPVLDRVASRTVLTIGTVVAAIAYPGFLLLPGARLKLVALAIDSLGTAPWYPLLQAEVFASLHGESPVAVTLNSAATIVGGLGPLAVGLAAEAFGLRAALAALAVVPLIILAGVANDRTLRPWRRPASA